MTRSYDDSTRSSTVPELIISDRRVIFWPRYGLAESRGAGECRKRVLEEWSGKMVPREGGCVTFVASSISFDDRAWAGLFVLSSFEPLWEQSFAGRRAERILRELLGRR